MPNTVRLVMKNMLCICALLALGAGPASAYKAHANSPAKVQASSMTKQQRKLCDEAAPLRKAVIKKYGRRAPGRDICRFGVRGGSLPSVKKLSDYLQTLQRQISPPAPPVAAAASPLPAAAHSQTATAQSYAPASSQGTGSSSTMSSIAQCESGNNPSTNTGNGFYGKYQFTLSTWKSVGGSGLPSSASAQEQDKRAAMLYSREGSSPWPVCGK